MWFLSMNTGNDWKATTYFATNLEMQTNNFDVIIMHWNDFQYKNKTNIEQFGRHSKKPSML